MSSDLKAWLGRQIPGEEDNIFSLDAAMDRIALQAHEYHFVHSSIVESPCSALNDYWTPLKLWQG
jgi:hypothetical protein